MPLRAKLFIELVDNIYLYNKLLTEIKEQISKN